MAQRVVIDQEHTIKSWQGAIMGEASLVNSAIMEDEVLEQMQELMNGTLIEEDGKKGRENMIKALTKVFNIARQTCKVSENWNSETITVSNKGGNKKVLD